MFCPENCPHLSCNEETQDLLRFGKEPHRCLLYGITLLHGPHHPNIVAKENCNYLKYRQDLQAKDTPCLHETRGVDFIHALRDKLPSGVKENISDKWHTFKELYDYRMVYHAALVNVLCSMEYPRIVTVKSKKHSDGLPCFDGSMFIVQTMSQDVGQISNHYDMDQWGMFECPEVEMAPEWDGHTPEIAYQRLRMLALRLAGEP